MVLSTTDRQVGDVAFTSPGRLERQGVLVLAHIVSIIKHTPQGSWCPHPEKLSAGVARALQFARHLQLHSAAFSALATGEGRVAPAESAHLMLQGLLDYRRDNPDWPLAVTFALPTEVDLEAFEKTARQLRVH